MITSSSPTRKPRRSGNHVIIRLERNNREIQSLKETLRSYVCEPKTYTLYERLEQIKFRMEAQLLRNRELIGQLRDRRQAFEDQLTEKIRQQLSEYRELEQQVLEYIGMAKMHC